MNEETNEGKLRRVVVANEFRLVNSKGEIRAVLEMDIEEQPCLVFYENLQTHPRMCLMLNNDNVASVEIWGQNGKSCITLHAFADGHLSLALWHDEEHKPRIGLKVKEDGEQVIVMYDGNEEMVWRTPVSRNSASS